MRRLAPAVLSLFVAAAASTLASAAVFPDHLMIQGRLEPRDIGGGRRTEAHLRVRLLDEAGVTLFEELHCDVPLSGLDGEIKLALGTVDPVANPLDLRFDAPWFVEIVACQEDACAGGVPADAGLCDGDVLLHEPLDVVAYAWRAKYAGEADHALTADDCDTLDGLDSSDFMPAGADRWVDEAGDTMTGPLVLSGAPTEDLHAATKRYVDEQIRNAIPPGYAILGPTIVSPPGFHATGERIVPDYVTRRMPGLPISGRMTAAFVDGTLHVLGGVRGEVFWWDRAAGTWAYLLPAPEIPDATMVESGGRLHLAGRSRHWSWDPVAGIARDHARHPRWAQNPLVASVDGVLYTLIGPDDTVTPRLTIEFARYDEAANTWVSLPPPPRARPGQILVGFDGRLWQLGVRRNDTSTPSEQSTRETWIYEPSSSSWTRGPDANAALSPFWEAYQTEAAAVAAGRLWMVSGAGHGWAGGGWWGGGFGDDGHRVDSIGPGESSWRAEPFSPDSPRWGAGVAGFADELHVLGGMSQYEDPVHDHEIIDIPTAWYLHVKD